MTEEVEIQSGVRFAMFLEEQGISKEKAAQIMDMRAAQLQRMIQGKNFRAHWILRMAQSFPDLNSVWLVTGKGNMLKSKEIVPTEQEKETIRLIDEARALRQRVLALPGKRKAELCGQVIETAERLMEDNDLRRVKILKIRTMFDNLAYEVKDKGHILPPGFD